MQTYFQNVINSERNIFGDICFLPENIRNLPIKSGDLNRLDSTQLTDALHSDFYVVFGASYIKGWLIDFLVEYHAINIHMSLSPYYRGSSCNFWALYDNHPSYMGATIYIQRNHNPRVGGSSPSSATNKKLNKLAPVLFLLKQELNGSSNDVACIWSRLMASVKLFKKFT